MAIGLVADNGSVFVEKEVTEGTYVAESAATSAVEVLADGVEFTPGRELLERTNRTSTVETVPSRLGTKSMACAIPIELKGHATLGAAPQAGDLWESLLGGVRSSASAVTTKAVGNTISTLEIEDADIGNFKVGDTIRVNETGAHHLSPITAVDTTGGAAKITLLVPRASSVFPNSVTIAPFTTYYHASGAPTLSLTQYLGGEIREKATGMRPVSAEIANYVTGQLANVPFSLEGLSYDREVGTPLFTPSFDAALPPVILKACVYKDGTPITVNAFSVSMTNSVGFLSSTCSENGKLQSRITKLNIAGSINPYMEDDDVDMFDIFNNGTEFSLFTRASNDDSTTGEVKESCAVYVPRCVIPELATGNEEGILTDTVSFTGHKTLGNDTIFVTFI